VPESYSVTFDSLKETKMIDFKGSAAEEGFVKLLLSRCNAKTLRRVQIIVEPYLFLRRSWWYVTGFVECVART
jgi:hypothetical protein